jgi:hypothetical protein
LAERRPVGDIRFAATIRAPVADDHARARAAHERHGGWPTVERELNRHAVGEGRGIARGTVVGRIRPLQPQIESRARTRRLHRQPVDRRRARDRRMRGERLAPPLAKVRLSFMSDCVEISAAPVCSDA